MTRVTYTTATNQTYNLQDFGRQSLYSTDVRGWSLDVDKTTGAATLSEQTYKATAVFLSRAAYDDFSEQVFEDTKAGLFGRLQVNDWQLVCQPTDWKVSSHYDTQHYTVELTLRAPDPVWRRFRTYSLSLPDGLVGDSLDYPHDYPFDLDGAAAGISGRTINLEYPALFRITFFGPCQNPFVTLSETGGRQRVNRFEVNAVASTGERIVIDPLGKRQAGNSIYRVGVYGDKTNLFDFAFRAEGRNAFASLGAGELYAQFNQTYDIDIETIEERGSLPWS